MHGTNDVHRSGHVMDAIKTEHEVVGRRDGQAFTACDKPLNISQTKFLTSFIQIGDGVRICSSAIILGRSRLKLADGVWLGHQALIICAADVEIGEDVDIGPRVFIGTGTHVPNVTGKRAGKEISAKITVYENSWIGAGAMVLPGVVIGAGTLVAAGAVVIRATAPQSTVAGVPATRIEPRAGSNG